MSDPINLAEASKKMKDKAGAATDKLKPDKKPDAPKKEPISILKVSVL